MDVQGEQRSVRLSVSTNEVLVKVENFICEDRCLTLGKLHTLIPLFSQSPIHNAITEQLGFNNPFKGRTHKLVSRHENGIERNNEYVDKYLNLYVKFTIISLGNQKNVYFNNMKRLVLDVARAIKLTLNPVGTTMQSNRKRYCKIDTYRAG